MKISIRPLQRDDARTSVKWRNITEIWRYTKYDTSKVITQEDEMQWIEKVITDKSCRRFAILADNKYVGNTYLTDINKSGADFHIFIGEKNYWGMGIAGETLKQVVEYAKKELGLEFISLEVNRRNKVALNLYKRYGFKDASKEGEFIKMKFNLDGS